MTDWYDKNKFKKILTAFDSNKFNHKNKVGKLKLNDINNLLITLKIIQLVKHLLSKN